MGGKQHVVAPVELKILLNVALGQRNRHPKAVEYNYSEQNKIAVPTAGRRHDPTK
jgi:hypothetical protein